MKIKLLLTVLVDMFRFIQRYRDRQAALREDAKQERERERLHQRLLVEGIATKLIDFSKSNQEGLLKVAEAQAAQAEVFKVWIESFKPTTNDPQPPSTVREEDEWRMEQEREAEHNPEGFVADLPPEFALALSLSKLEQDPNPGFDREGRDTL